MSFQSVFQTTFDIIICGSGYAAFSAALAARAAGKSVLLVDRQPAILWESGWAFAGDVGQSHSSIWQAFTGELSRCGLPTAGFIDGASAEIFGSKLLSDRGVAVLYYATPVAVHLENGHLTALAVAVKQGVKVLRASQYIDATERGELANLLTSITPVMPSRQRVRMFYRHAKWTDLPDTTLLSDQLPGAEIQWSKSPWENERIVSVDLPGDFARHRAAWVPALSAVREQFSKELEQAVLTHGSVAAFPVYSAREGANDTGNSVPANVAIASPGLLGNIATLAERFDLGLRGAEQLQSASSAKPAKLPHDFPRQAIRSKQQSTDVVVAGAGTGGAFAAIAAARQGAQVVAVEPLPFVGGIGAGGGIHWYYFGVRGGLQEEIDERTRAIMPLFAGKGQLQGFHPDAKKIIIEETMAGAGVNMLMNAQLYGVDSSKGRVSAAHVATADGPTTLAAPTWIDATGDGDLAAFAGASFILGRQTDGQLHAFSQSSGYAAINNEGVARMAVVNFDAGFVDPTDSEDLTRARRLGVSHYERTRHDQVERTTYIAPALGLRQGRQFETDYVLTLQDLINRRQFDDAVGRTGCHYDNHAIDYEFESDEAMFWVWVCRQWSGRIACEIPYRMLLPVGLENVWIACRAAGVSIEAHHSFRMQRDIQRLGEIAGLSAALAVKEKTDARHVPYPQLRSMLEASGALKADTTPEEQFGPKTTAEQFSDEVKPAGLDQWMADLMSVYNGSMYHLWHHRKAAEPRVLPLVSDAEPGISFRAAAVTAMWDLPAAEPRLIRAIADRESGFESEAEPRRPDKNNRHVPNWIVAIALLRRCGTGACLDELFKLAGDPQLLHSARTATALTVSAISNRVKLTPEQKNVVVAILKKLLDTPSPNAVGNPQRKPIVPEQIDPNTVPPHRKPVEDQTWQLHLAVAHAENAAKLPIHPEAEKFLNDPRATVRKAFVKVLQNF